MYFVNFISCFHQYIQQIIRHDNTRIEEILEPPEGQDEGVWKYEHLRYRLFNKILDFRLFNK